MNLGDALKRLIAERIKRIPQPKGGVRLKVLASEDLRKSAKHKQKRNTTATHVNKGRDYPYNSKKRGWL